MILWIHYIIDSIVLVPLVKFTVESSRFVESINVYPQNFPYPLFAMGYDIGLGVGDIHIDCIVEWVAYSFFGNVDCCDSDRNSSGIIRWFKMFSIETAIKQSRIIFLPTTTRSWYIPHHFSSFFCVSHRCLRKTPDHNFQALCWLCTRTGVMRDMIIWWCIHFDGTGFHRNRLASFNDGRFQAAK